MKIIETGHIAPRAAGSITTSASWGPLAASVASIEILDARGALEVNASEHVAILPPPIHISYDSDAPLPA
jgi:hypothetical protein